MDLDKSDIYREQLTVPPCFLVEVLKRRQAKAAEAIEKNDAARCHEDHIAKGLKVVKTRK